MKLIGNKKGGRSEINTLLLAESMTKEGCHTLSLYGQRTDFNASNVLAAATKLAANGVEIRISNTANSEESDQVISALNISSGGTVQRSGNEKIRMSSRWID